MEKENTSLNFINAQNTNTNQRQIKEEAESKRNNMEEYNIISNVNSINMNTNMNNNIYNSFDIDQVQNTELVNILNKYDDDYIANHIDTINNEKSNYKISEPNQKFLEDFNKNITIISDKISDLIATEKNNIMNNYENLYKAQHKYNEFKETELKNLEQQKAKWFSIFCKGLNKSSSEIIQLNVGGTHDISTTRGILTKYPLSLLAFLFSGKYDLPMLEGKVFIDREGQPFSDMIHYLRTGKFPNFEKKRDSKLLLNELLYWKIPYVITKNNIPADADFCFDSIWCAQTLNLESNKCLIRKNSKYTTI